MDLIVRALKMGLFVAIVYAGIQFAGVYFRQVQLTKCMSDEALDARRSKTTEAYMMKAIEDRCALSATERPEFDELKIEGLGKRGKDLVITARYTEVIDLKVYKHVMVIDIEARADAPD